VWDAILLLAVNSGELSEAVLDDRVADLLRVKMMLGLFDDPMTGLVPYSWPSGLVSL
jgi:beta-glucosidase-like glycosyl hydrolase